MLVSNQLDIVPFLLLANDYSALVGVGLRVLEESNVIIRNIKISKVLADAGDAIGKFDGSFSTFVFSLILF